MHTTSDAAPRHSIETAALPESKAAVERAPFPVGLGLILGALASFWINLAIVLYLAGQMAR